MSPSRYSAFQECELREILSASGNKPLLPIAPEAELGSVIHLLLEAAGRGDLDEGSQKQVAQSWNYFLLEAEEKMARSPLTRPQVPLNESVPDYEVRKLRAFKRAAEIAREASRSAKTSDTPTSKRPTFEFWVESNDGAIGGRIDRALMTGKGLIISDYKSGFVFEDVAEGNQKEVKIAYRQQMELYAALFHAKFIEWPDLLEILPLQGDAVIFSYSRDEASSLLQEASDRLCKINKSVEKILSSSESEWSLSSPKAKHCRFCLYRPACVPYWELRTKDEEQRWPYDVRGTIVDINELRGGKLCIQLLPKSKDSAIITIRNITDSLERYPELDQISIDSQVAFYGLQYQYHSQDYSESRMTVLYKDE